LGWLCQSMPSNPEIPRAAIYGSKLDAGVRRRKRGRLKLTPTSTRLLAAVVVQS
jgi:hypothetical protein